MKKHELLKKAYDEYPKGTKFTWPNGNQFISNGNFKFPFDDENHIYSVNDKGIENTLFDGVKWAEIVKPKIAVKVENEKEFKTLMKYYDSLGWKWSGGSDPMSRTSIPEYPNLIMFQDGFMHSLTKETIKNGDYQIIPFADFSKEHGIKLPLFTNEQGHEFYDKTPCQWVFSKKEGGFELGVSCSFCENHIEMISKGTQFPFRDKESALSWIEAQKPKTYELDCGIISDKGLAIRNGLTFLNKVEIEVIAKYIQELNKK